MYQIIYSNIRGINLRPETGALGAQVIKGNVYFDNQLVFDDEWGHKEAKVVCRFKFLISWIDNFSRHD